MLEITLEHQEKGMNCEFLKEEQLNQDTREDPEKGGQAFSSYSPFPSLLYVHSQTFFKVLVH